MKPTLLKPTQILKLNCWYTTAETKFNKIGESLKRYWRTWWPQSLHRRPITHRGYNYPNWLGRRCRLPNWPKNFRKLAKRVECKWQSKLTLDQLKEKSKNLLVPENSPKLSVSLTNKEVFSQLNNAQKKADLRLRNLQKNIQKTTIALVQVTDSLLQDKGETKAMIKNNLDAISLMRHSWKDISTMRRQKIKPFLNRTCASLCDLEYTDTQQLFWEDINKSLNRAKDVGNLKKQMFPETTRTAKNSFQPFPKTRTHGRNSFLYKSPNNQRELSNKYKND